MNNKPLLTYIGLIIEFLDTFPAILNENYSNNNFPHYQLMKYILEQKCKSSSCLDKERTKRTMKQHIIDNNKTFLGIVGEKQIPGEPTELEKAEINKIKDRIHYRQINSGILTHTYNNIKYIIYYNKN